MRKSAHAVANLTPGWGIQRFDHWLNMQTHPPLGKNQDGRCVKWPNTLWRLSLFLVPTVNPTWMVPGSSVPLMFWCWPCSYALMSSFHVATQKSGSHEHMNMALHMHHSPTWDKFRHSVYFPDIWGLKSKFIHWHNHPLNAGWGFKLPLMFSGLQTGLTTIVMFVA